MMRLRPSTPSTRRRSAGWPRRCSGTRHSGWRSLLLPDTCGASSGTSACPAEMTVARTADPATDLRLARLHLRMGQLGLARAELESLAGSADLGEDGLLALAEVRWRTADLTGAGEAADAYLSGGGDAAIGFVIAAEAMVAAGHTTEARDLAARALDAADVPIDQIFAGMPRSTIWPVDTADAGLGSGALSGDRQPLRRARSTILQPSEI